LITIKVGKDPIVRGNIETITVTVSDRPNPSKKVVGAGVSGELFYQSGYHKSVSCSTTDRNGKSQCSFKIGPDSIPGKFRITMYVSASGYKPTSKSATFTVIPANATIPTNATNTNATNTNATNTNATNTNITNTLPTNLTNTSNMSSIVSKPPSNTSAAIQPGNTSNPTSGEGKGKGTTCTAGNCTSGPQTTKMCPDGSLVDSSASCATSTPPPLSPALTPALTTAIDCKAHPNDPSCTQTLTPSPTTPTAHTCPDGSQPDSTGKCSSQQTLLSTQNPNSQLDHTGKTKTKTCPDGSIIPKKDECPTAQSLQSNPNTSNTAPTGNNPQPSGNIPPSNNGNIGGGENGGGSPPSQPSTLESGNSNGGEGGSSSSSSSGHSSDSDHDGSDSGGKSNSDDSNKS
jgi:hypothetical protein